MTSRTITTSQERPTPQWRPVARRVLIVLLQWASWFWFSAVIIVCGVLFTISRFTDVTLSGVQFVHQTALWFQFAMAISVVVVYLPVHVAAGTTRRSFIRGALIAAGTTAVGYTAVLICSCWSKGRSTERSVGLTAEMTNPLRRSLPSACGPTSAARS